MRIFLSAPLAALLFLIAHGVALAGTAAAQFVSPKVESNRAEIRQVCHHYRGSSRTHCTSAQVLQYYYGKQLYYPQKYFGGTPHYYVRQPRYWHDHPGYYHHRWLYGPFRHYPFYW